MLSKHQFFSKTYRENDPLRETPENQKHCKTGYKVYHTESVTPVLLQR